MSKQNPDGSWLYYMDCKGFTIVGYSGVSEKAAYQDAIKQRNRMCLGR